MVYILLILGFLGLIYGGNLLVEGSVRLAQKWGVSPLLIGLTLVGFGTSTPELMTSLLAVFQKSEGIAVGNVIGSNIANILLVLGVAAVISPVPVDRRAFKRDGLFLGLSTLALIGAVLSGEIGRCLGGLLVGILVFYVAYSYWSEKKRHTREKAQEAGGSGWKALAQTIIGIALTLGGAKMLVYAATNLAVRWHISEAVIGLTVVAVGTSLPEMITSIVAAVRRKNEVAFGNVIGSNIYNALFILGLTAIFMPVRIPAKMGSDLWIMVASTVALMGIAFWKKEFSRRVGILFLTAYAVYVWRLFA